MFKTLLHSSLIFSMLLIFGLSSNGQAEKKMATRNSRLKATVTEVEQLEDRSMWVWRNTFDNNFGLLSCCYLENPDTAGGKSCIIADDFQVPSDSIWLIDTLRTYWYYSKVAPDYMQVLIWPDLGGVPAGDTIYHDFTFDAGMTQPLALYDLRIGVESQNIVLPEGIYWISFIGVYETGTFEEAMTDTIYALWNCKDTMLGPQMAQCRDSLGAYYVPPQPWVGIIFDGENPYNSVKFWIKADVDVGISNSNYQKHRALVSVFPNPASEHIMFRLQNVNGKYIEIYDVKGKLVKTVTALMRNQRVNIKSLTNGIYFYQLVDKSRKMIDRGRFSISK